MGLPDQCFAVSATREGSRAVVVPKGDIDIASAPALRRALTEVVEELGNLSVTVDLADVTFVDSMGITVLFGAYRRLRDRGGDLRVVNPTPPVARVLDLTGFSSYVAERSQRPLLVDGGSAA